VGVDKNIGGGKPGNFAVDRENLQKTGNGARLADIADRRSRLGSGKLHSTEVSMHFSRPPENGYMGTPLQGKNVLVVRPISRV